MLIRGGLRGKRFKYLCQEIVRSCPTCARSGLPIQTNKVSLPHVCESFNQKMQVNIGFFNIRSNKYCALHVVDAGTGYSETSINGRRSAGTMASKLELICILRHGIPQKFSADSMFTKEPMKTFPDSHNIIPAEGPVCRYNKTSIIERKHKTVKLKIESLRNDLTSASDTVLLSRAIFFSNMFNGSSVLYSFELVRGYKPALHGANRWFVPNKLIEAYRDKEYTRVLQCMLRSRRPSFLSFSALASGFPIIYF